MDIKKVWCSVVEAAVWSDRCLFKLSKIIEGSRDCESCLLRELEKIKFCGKEAKTGKKRKPKAKQMRGPRSIVDVPNDINDVNDTKDTKDTKGVKKKSRRAKARRGRKPGAITVAPPDPGQTYTVQDLSKLLGKPKRRIQELALLGEFPGHKVGRTWQFPKEEIDKWLSEKSTVSFKRNDVVMTQSEPSNGEDPRPSDQNDEGSPNHGS